MQFTEISIFRLAVFFAILGVATASSTRSLGRRQTGNTFNFDFEHPGTGDVGTIVWDLSRIPIRHPFVDNVPAGVDAAVTALARSAFAASVTGEDIFCEVFQNDRCERTKDQPSFCVMGEKFSRTQTEVAPFRTIWPKTMHGKARCLVCDKKNVPGACTKTEERKA